MPGPAARILEDVDFVALDAVEVIIQGQQHLHGDGSTQAGPVWGQYPQSPGQSLAPRRVRQQRHSLSHPTLPVRCWGTHQEGAEHGDGGEEVPDVVVVEEVQQDAVPVVLPRLSRGLLQGAQAEPAGHPLTATTTALPAWGDALAWPQGAPPRPTYLPGAETLEEEEEGEAPDHGGADDAEQRDELDAFPAPELGGDGTERDGARLRELPRMHWEEVGAPGRPQPRSLRGRGLPPP